MLRSHGASRQAVKQKRDVMQQLRQRGSSDDPARFLQTPRTRRNSMTGGSTGAAVAGLSLSAESFRQDGGTLTKSQNPEMNARTSIRTETESLPNQVRARVTVTTSNFDAIIPVHIAINTH
eukprot:scaffold464874_cov26-Prasinocladus_malaysianus.AAC.1